jgi:hypothetical protein
MEKPPRNYFWWEGLPYIAVAITTIIWVLGEYHRAVLWDLLFYDPNERYGAIISALVVFFILAAASGLLHLLRRSWPGKNARWRSVQFVFLGGGALILTVIAMLMLSEAPVLLDMDQDRIFQENQ